MSMDEEMHEAARDLRFEYAARFRDEINELKREYYRRLPRPDRTKLVEPNALSPIGTGFGSWAGLPVIWPSLQGEVGTVGAVISIAVLASPISRAS